MYIISVKNILLKNIKGMNFASSNDGLHIFGLIFN